jgi:hypothetical protein
VGESRLSLWPFNKIHWDVLSKSWDILSKHLRSWNTTKCQKAKNHKEIELNFDASCQQILGLESEILWEAGSTTTLTSIQTAMFFYPRVYVVYRRVYILLCCWGSWCWEAFNQTCQYIGRRLIKHDQTWSDMIRHDQKLDQTRSDMMKHDQTLLSNLVLF